MSDLENKSEIANIEVNETVLDEIKQYCDDAGVSVPTMYQCLSEGLRANKINIDKFGDEHAEPDHVTRHKYLLTALELLQHLKRSNADAPVVGTSVSQTNIYINKYDIDERAAHLFKINGNT